MRTAKGLLADDSPALNLVVERTTLTHGGRPAGGVPEFVIPNCAGSLINMAAGFTADLRESGGRRTRRRPRTSMGRALGNTCE